MKVSMSRWHLDMGCGKNHAVTACIVCWWIIPSAMGPVLLIPVVLIAEVCWPNRGHSIDGNSKSADVSCRKFTTHCMLFTLCFLDLEGRAITPLILAIQRQYPLELGSIYTLSQKNVPPLTCYNLDMHGSVTIIFGTSVTKKVGNQNVLHFPTSPNFCFCITKPEKCIFSLKCCMLFTKNMNTLKYPLATWEPPFTVKRSTGCTRQDLESCCLLSTCSMLTKSVMVLVAV